MLNEISQSERQISYDFIYMWNLKKNINGQTKQKQTHRHRGQTEDWQRREGLGNCVKKVKGLRSTDWQLQNSRGDAKYSTGSTVNNSVIAIWCQLGTGNIRGHI